MAIYSNIDLETFQWVRGEVEHTLTSATGELEQFALSEDSAALLNIGTQMHQVLGSLQMLELKSLSSLVLESELLIEDFSKQDSKIGKSSMVVLLEDSFKALRATFDRIESGLPENPVDRLRGPYTAIRRSDRPVDNKK